jgi:hypothetical protein
MNRKKSNAPKIIIPVGKILKSPIIGSGRISRRIIIKPFKTKKQSTLNSDISKMLANRMLNENIASFSTQANRPSKKPIPFKTAAAKIIFNYWNNLGHPFVSHKLEFNKTTATAVEKLNKIIPKYGNNTIINAIKMGHEIFNASWFKYRIHFSKYKIGLPDFIEYPADRFNKISRQCSEIPRSWLKECLKDQEHLENKYSIILKDRHPQITKRLVAIWKAYNKYNKVSTRDANNLTICGKLLYSFSKKNNISPLSIIDLIDGMLNKWKTYTPKHSGYLINSIFWQDNIPRELIRYGIFSDLRKIKI